MKLCIPIEEDKGLESIPYGHFGSAPLFMLVDSETEETRILDNGKEEHNHGACNPLQNFAGEDVDALLVAGIGVRAVTILNEMKIKVLKVVPGNVKDNLDALKNGTICEFSADSACRGHH